ncbi:MAG TPA: tetratricopeptide repeat protein [Ktedonobacteraceae bacterium]|nr:tetratricopeptide repeat protein [Ktedonobacteraceae bacterium]
MLNEASHVWIAAPYQLDRDTAWLSVKAKYPDEQQIFYRVDCHRNLRGPYSGMGELIRQLVPSIFLRWPEHVMAHATEILAVAPELSPLLKSSREALDLQAIPEERSRFYARLRTLSLAHGLTDFLRGVAVLTASKYCFFVFKNVHEADVLDQEAIEVLLRRAGETMRIVVETGLTSLPESLQATLRTCTQPLHPRPLKGVARDRALLCLNLPPVWTNWLRQTTNGWPGEWQYFETLVEDLEELTSYLPNASLTFQQGIRDLLPKCSLNTRYELAKKYIVSVCTGDTPLERAAYEQLDPVVVRHLHDEQGRILEPINSWSLRIGAIPYHRERGQDPTGAGALALKIGINYCVDQGYYGAAVDFGNRGREAVNWEAQTMLYWLFTAKMASSLAALERPEEAELLYKEARAFTSDPLIHMQAAYATAMLYSRHYPPLLRDYSSAKAWINEAIALARMLPDPELRAYQTVFNQNGLALIELHIGNPQEALRLVTEGMERLDREMGEDKLLQHRSVLLYNRAQVYNGTDELEKALSDYTRVIQQDPGYSEYYFDRGNLYRKLGRNEEALQDYSLAISLSPPYPEAYFNRANVLVQLERPEEAIADYNYVLELDSTFIDALLSRANLYYEAGDYATARKDLERCLKLNSKHPASLCALGLLEMAEEHIEEANRAFTAALELDPSMIEAWSNRAVLAFENGDVADAIEDLTCALDLRENATVLYNRARAYQSQKSWLEAIADYTQALGLENSISHTQEMLYQRAHCYLGMGRSEEARKDLEAHLALGPSPFSGMIDELMVPLQTA